MGRKITDGTAVFEVKDVRETDKVTKEVTVDGVKIFATTPHHYSRVSSWTPGKRTVTMPSYLTVNIGDRLYQTTEEKTLNIDQAASWDTSSADFVTAGNRKGKDFYIYACAPESGSAPEFILSANSTMPAGYTGTNSRKIGGFHCECANVGTISGNALSGWLAGEILPASAWDLLHRARSENEGMVYDALDDVWISIYLLSLQDGVPASVYRGVILDGSSATPYHGLKFTEELARIGMRLPYLHEYFNAFKGVTENITIKNAADPNTTGGHVHSNGVRIVSSIGLEDCTGVLWQWSNNYGMAGGNGWGNSNFDSTIDGSSGYGRAVGTLWLPCAGGHWGDGGSCGSRAAYGNRSAGYRDAVIAGRGASEPRSVAL